MIAPNFTIHNADAIAFMRDAPEGAFDAIITDPPFSERTHTGFNRKTSMDGHIRRGLAFAHLDAVAIGPLCREMHRLARGWVVWLTDHVLAPSVIAGLEGCGRYVFAPIPFVSRAHNVRLSGDGPASATIWIIASRPRSKDFIGWGSLPGYYLSENGWGKGEVIGGKPVGLLSRLIADYTREGEAVFDPFMGAGSAGVAALRLGRSFVGCEIDPGRFQIAKKAIEAAANCERSRLFK